MKTLLILAFGLFAACASFANLLGVVKAGRGAHIDLFSEAGICLKGALRAEYVPDIGKPIIGCWILSNNADLVFVVFLDGETATIQVSNIRPPKDL